MPTYMRRKTDLVIELMHQLTGEKSAYLGRRVVDDNIELSEEYLKLQREAHRLTSALLVVLAAMDECCSEKQRR